MDTEKTEREKKPIIDHITDLAAEAAGTLAETAVKAVGKRAKKAVAKSGATPVRKAARIVAKDRSFWPLAKLRSASPQSPVIAAAASRAGA